MHLQPICFLLPNELPPVQLKTGLKDGMQSVSGKLTNAYNSKCECCEKRNSHPWDLVHLVCEKSKLALPHCRYCLEQ